MANETIFFSYSRVDSAFALKLAKDLRNVGAGIWLDQLDIKPGSHWDSSIKHALNAAAFVIVILSPSSIASTNVMDEVSFALEDRKKLIPVLLINCKTPFRLRRLQHINFTGDYESGFNLLVQTLNLSVSEGDKNNIIKPEQAVSQISETNKSDTEKKKSNDSDKVRKDKNEFIQHLKRMTTEGGEDSFLIVSIGDIYVQLAALKGKTKISVETVSNEYLPKHLKLNENQVEELMSWNFFEKPSKGYDNFHVEYELKANSDFERLADTTMLIFFQVHGCPESSKIDYQLNLD